jgi:DNA-binding SARP family transcriptional activator
MEFRVLGPVEVWVAGQPVAAGHARQRAVLAVLVLDLGHVVPAELLIDRVWAENPPASVRNVLHGYLARLRASLSNADDPGVSLSRERGGYQLRCAPELVDLFGFRRLAAEAASADDEHALSLLGEALALWHGPALAGLHSPWLDAMRQSLEMERTAAELNLNDIRLRHGHDGALAAKLAGQAADRPTDERLIGQLMLALYRSGRQADALAAYWQARRVLVEELGTDPGPELQKLHQQILTADPALSIADPAMPTASAAGRAGSAPPRQLPAAAVGFTGRAAEPAALTSIPDGAGATADAGDSAPGTVVMSAQQRLDKASRELAIAVARQWRAEAVMRSLGRPEPIQLSWSITRRTAALVPLAVRRRDPRMGAVPPNLHGDLSHLITEFRRLPKRQLVVLGEPGAGKTALAVLLTLGLLANPEPREPVPVLLPLSSWDPRNEHLYTWFAHKLTEEYPGLGNVAAYGPHVARRLVTDERVMPVLDGLDETPPDLQAAAIDAIDLATAGGRPLVVTCRSTEYEEAVLRGGVILSSAMVVEMQPVDIEDAARFLTARQHPGLSGWQPVVEHLRRHPRGPLAQVMSTPLMVDLARTAYSGSASDPAELSDAMRFPDRASLEEHLLDAFLPAAYPQQLPRLSSAAGIRPAALLQYEPGQARRWLTFLARHLQSGRTRDLAWWQLAEAIPQPARGLIFAFPPALIFAVAGELAGGPRVGIVYGVAFGLAGFAVNSLGRRPAPLRVELRFRGTAARFVGRFAVGLVIGAVLGLGWSLSHGLVLMLGLVFGLALGVHVWLDTPADAGRVSSPSTVMKQERTAALSYTLTFALSMGTFYVAADTFTNGTTYVPVFGGSFDIALALVTGMVVAPLARFAFGRPGGVAYGLAAAVAGGLIFPHASTLSGGLLAGTVFGIATGLAIFLSRAWGSFILTRAWLTIRGKTPLRLMRFLADAHRRAVLRQVGAVYQFRHARLQDNLANRRNS